MKIALQKGSSSVLTTYSCCDTTAKRAVAQDFSTLDIDNVAGTCVHGFVVRANPIVKHDDAFFVSLGLEDGLQASNPVGQSLQVRLQ